MNTGSQRVDIPAGFSGWWCARCEQACPTIPEDLDAREAKCPHCRKWTAVWVPPQASALLAQPPEQPASNRERAGEARQLSAGAPWTRKIPTTERSKALFEHLRAVVDNPELNPDLSELERQEYER